MENDFDIRLEKFMQTMGITYTIEISRGYRDTTGRRNVCLEIRVEYKRAPQYIQSHCYKKVGDAILYVEGNRTMSISEGILAYLGDNRKVDEYFDRLARDKFKKYFHSDF